MRTKKHLVKNIVTFVLAIALTIGMIPVMPGSIKAQAYSESGFLWNGTEGYAFVNTDPDDDSVGSCWYVITDNEDGGKSKVVFNQADPYGDGSTIIDEDIDMYSGISGTAVLDKGTLDYNPYVYICFDIYGKYETGSPIITDISNYWDGLAISYMCDCNATLELGLGDNEDARIGYANPYVDLKANDNGLVKAFKWAQFNQPAWHKADQEISIEKVPETLATVKIKIQAPDSSGGTFHFMIDRIGTYGSISSPVVLKDQGYIITYEGVEGASFENSNPDRYTIKDSITLNNPSKEGYEFAGWTGTGLDAATNSVTIPEKSTGNRVYTATWTPIDYDITKSAEHGTFTVKKGDTEVTKANYNDILTLTATPDTGYKFVSWTVKDKDNNDITVTDNTFTMPAGDVNISAKFKTLGSFEWIGKNGKAQVETYRGNETDTQGIWYVRTDENGYESIDNYAGYGNSKVIFDKADPDGDSSTVTDDDVNKYWGVSGTAILDQGSLNANPFVYICFDIVGKTSDTDNTRVADDVSAWEGLSISYECDGDPELELSLGDEDVTIGSARPRVSLPEAVAGNGVVKNLAWSDFEQPSWAQNNEKISGNEAAEKLVTVMFKIQGKSGTYHFKIAGIGSYHDSHLTVPEDPDGYYSITYHLNEGTNAESNISKYTINTKTFTLADPSREGYKFAGWFSDAEFNTPATTTIERGSTGDREFYAKWVNIALETIDKINSLPNAQDVTFLDKKNIEDARASYDALSDENKNLISEEILKKLTDAEYAFDTNVGNGTETNPYKVNTWDELKEAMAEGGFIRLSDNVSDPAPAENSYLAVKSGIYVNLDLNGYTIDRGLTDKSGISNGKVIYLYARSSLDLYDSRTGGKITGGYSVYDGGGIYISGYSTLNMYGGTITGNTTVSNSQAGNGGGVYVGGSGTLNMYGGSITGNKAIKGSDFRGASGGGVYTSNKGSFYMYGGTISGNTAENEGANVYVYCLSETKNFIMTGGTIDGGVVCSSPSKIFALSFDPNGGNGIMTEQYISNGTDTPLKDFEYTAPAGKLFKGWSFTANGDVKFTNKQKIKIEYYHNYIDDDNYESGYSLTIYNNDGTEIVDSIEIGENSTVKLYAIYVDKATLASTVAITDWTYGDTPVEPGIKDNLGNGAVSYTYSSDGVNFTEEVPYEAGDYFVKAAIEETDVYKSAEVTKAFSIKKRPVTITAGSATKVYDGTALTSNEYTVSENALVNDEVLSEVTLTGSRKEVGSSANVASGAVILNGEIDVTANYDINYVYGTLKVTKNPVNDVTITITGDVDGDGQITPKDVTKLRRFLAGGWNVEVSVENADIDGDGKVTPKDVTMLRRYLAGGWGISLG